ncbi:hypothetical protein Btru_051846 [Bulinus truncatus]|nr:hypothetical protein Btru_051846 [Bulinus truncatus]
MEVNGSIGHLELWATHCPKAASDIMYTFLLVVTAGCFEPVPKQHNEFYQAVTSYQLTCSKIADVVIMSTPITCPLPDNTESRLLLSVSNIVMNLDWSLSITRCQTIIGHFLGCVIQQSCSTSHSRKPDDDKKNVSAIPSKTISFHGVKSGVVLDQWSLMVIV